MDADALFRDHSPALLRYLVRLSGDAATAEDVLQETFVRVIERPPSEGNNLRAWLFTVATNLVRDGARARERRRRLLHDGGGAERIPVAPGTTPAEELERAELRARLGAALSALSEKERVAIVMREEGFTHREIAEALGTTTGTIGTLLARAFDKLARRLDLDRSDS